MSGKSKVFFICEVSRSVGYGHFKRCLVLAGIYQRLGFEVVFLMRKAVASAVELLSGLGMELVVRDSLDACFGLVRENVSKTALLIVDHYGIGSDLERTIWGAVPVLVLDDLCRFHHCDILADQTLGREASSYGGNLLNADAVVLTGSRYTLIDPVYRGIRSSRDMDQILVSFGATDPSGWALKVLNLLGRHPLGRDLTFHLPLSSAAPCRGDLERFSAQSGMKIRLYWDLPDLSRLYRCCGIALGAPGTSLFERIFCGLVNLTLVVAENQAEVGRQVAGRGAVVSLGDARSLDGGRLVELLSRVVSDPETAGALRERAGALVDGLGGERVVGATLEKIAPVVLRPAERTDMEFLFRLQHESGARQYFFNPAPPDPDTHKAWFDSVLSRQHRHLYVVNWNGNKVGYIRLDRQGEESEVSIMIGRKFRGVGLARQALDLATSSGSGPYAARIHPENKASINLFISAGFKAVGEGRFQYHGEPL